MLDYSKRSECLSQSHKEIQDMTYETVGLHYKIDTSFVWFYQNNIKEWTDGI
jgi:hypothetical protein